MTNLLEETLERMKGVSDKKARDLFQIYDKLPGGLDRKWTAGIRDLCENWEFRNGKYLRAVPQYERILSMEREGITRKEMASRLGCTPENIGAIVRGTNYNHFKETALLDKGEDVLS